MFTVQLQALELLGYMMSVENLYKQCRKVGSVKSNADQQHCESAFTDTGVGCIEQVV